MKKLTILLVLAAFLGAGCAFAAEAQNKGYISVSAEASEELEPTIVKLSFSIEAKANDAKTASENNKKTSEAVINAVKGLIDEKKGEMIKTTSYYLNPEYIYKDGARKLSNYRASNSLTVTLKDTNKAGKVISTALQNGANSISGVEFSLEETGESCNALISKAAQNAKSRAEKTAESIGTSITGIKNISTSCSTMQNFSSNFRMMKNAVATDSVAGEAASAMPVEAGKTKLNAYVNADFYVK